MDRISNRKIENFKTFNGFIKWKHFIIVIRSSSCCFRCGMSFFIVLPNYKYFYQTTLYPTNQIITLLHTPALNWPYATAVNTLIHSLLGNKKKSGYKLTFWNCRRKLVGHGSHETEKLIDIKNKLGLR